MDPGSIKQELYSESRGDERREDTDERLLSSETSFSESVTDSESVPDDLRCLLGLREAATDSECGSERSKGGGRHSNKASCVAFSSDSGDSLSDAGDERKVEERTREQSPARDSPAKTGPMLESCVLPKETKGNCTEAVKKAEGGVAARSMCGDPCEDAETGKVGLECGDGGVLARFGGEPRAVVEGSCSVGEELGLGTVASEDERDVTSLSEKTAAAAPTTLDREASAPKTPNHGESRQRIQLTVESSDGAHAKINQERTSQQYSGSHDGTDVDPIRRPENQTVGSVNDSLPGGQVEQNSQHGNALVGAQTHGNESAPDGATDTSGVFSNSKNVVWNGIAEPEEPLVQKDTPRDKAKVEEWGSELNDAHSKPMLRNGKEPRAYDMEVCLVPMSGRFFSHDDRIEAGENQKQPFVKLSKIDTIDKWPHDKFAALEAAWQRRDANAKKFKGNTWRKKHSSNLCSMVRTLGAKKPKHSSECGVQADLDSPIHSDAGDDSCITKQILSGAFHGANSEKSVNSKPVQNLMTIQQKNDRSEGTGLQRGFHAESKEKQIRRYSEKKAVSRCCNDSKMSESTVEPNTWPQPPCGVAPRGPVNQHATDGKLLEKNESTVQKSTLRKNSSDQYSGRKASQGNHIHDRWTTWVPPEEKEKSNALAWGTPPLPPNPKPKKTPWKQKDWQWGSPATPNVNKECGKAEWGLPCPPVSNKIWNEGGGGGGKVDVLPGSYFDCLPDPFKTVPNCGAGRSAWVGADVNNKQRKWRSSTWQKPPSGPQQDSNPGWGRKHRTPQGGRSTSSQENRCPVKELDGGIGGGKGGGRIENKWLAFSGPPSGAAPISPMRRVFEWIPSPTTDFTEN